jgi:NitT/TauT family transport system ATP-binding protein
MNSLRVRRRSAPTEEVDATPPSQGKNALYSVVGLGMTYTTDGKPNPVIQDITFDVTAGEIIAIVGRSGTGKTTLMRALGGLLAPSAGHVSFDGVPLRGPTDGIVTVFQDYGNALLPWRTVERNIALPLERTTGKTERASRVADALRMVGLTDKRTSFPWELSGGMQQRVQIARALALRPRVLLMDEPFGALDAMTKATLQDELLQVQAETGATIIFITHDLEEAIYLSDRVLVIAGSPGTVPIDVETALPRPREQITTRELPRYLETRHFLSGAIHEH